jgi:ABC-type transport system involved in cytochrome c biogenesis ATPase subunit
MNTLKKHITENKLEFLIIDGIIPIVTNSTLLDEMVLYNLTDSKIKTLLKQFREITGKSITGDTKINTLSFGQKIIAAILMSINCKAPKVLLRRVSSSIDKSKLDTLIKMIEKESQNGRIFKLSDE